MKSLFRFSKPTAAMYIYTAMVVVALQGHLAMAQYFPTVDDAYNPNEDRQSFDLVMKPYPIPAETTTYVDFFFNLPEDLPDIFHVTYGEVLNSQPKHLHHFVLTGCPETIDPSQDGEASDFELYRPECLQPIAVWAPGSDLFGNVDLDTGVLMGKGLGTRALQLNVHYTDGVYADEALETLKIATDGIRIHYTSTFRPYSSLSKELINVGTAPRQLTIPPGESRFYLSRTCAVETSCQDATQDTLDIMTFALGLSAADVEGLLGVSELNCEAAKPLCNVGGEVGSYILRLCPATCGLCEKGTDGAINPLNPDTYRITAVQYHAHLLGREMYTTLIREEEEPDTNVTAAVARQAPGTNVVAKDIQSREFWIYDFQETIPLDFDVVKEDTIMRGTEIKAGDRFQATCVFDSSYRDEPTIFHLSTYDEMCINWIRVTFDTPASLMDSDGETNVVPSTPLDLGAELSLMLFRCADDAGGDVYSGILTPEEDGRDIWKDHPVDKAEGCTYATSDFLQGVLTEVVRNCEVENLLCDANVEFLSENNAGASCQGGTLDQQDSNSGVTQEACEDGGGDYYPYSCGDIDGFLRSGADGLDEGTVSLLVNDWWKPKCCGDAVGPVCDANVEFLSENNAGATCQGGTLDQQDSNAGVTQEACEDGGGNYYPYSCGDIDGFLHSGADGLDEGTVSFLVNDWWKPKCCGDAVGLVCDANVEFLSENNAGASCQGGTLDQQDSNAGVTQEACEDGGGNYNPYSCGDADEYLRSEADGLDEGTVSFLVNDWWKPKCCGDAVSESSPEDEEPLPQEEPAEDEEPLPQEEPAEDEEPSAEENEASSEDLSSAAPDLLKRPSCLLSLGSAVSILLIVLWG